MSDGWPFDESLEQILDLSTWSVTTEGHAAPPELAAKMRAANFTRAQSETAIPLTTGALTRLISAHWPSPAAESLAARDERSVTFRWLNFLFVVYDNLYIEQHRTTPDGVAIRSDLWPKTNAATRTFEHAERFIDGEYSEHDAAEYRLEIEGPYCVVRWPLYDLTYVGDELPF
jgi:hypothetical protein